MNKFDGLLFGNGLSICLLDQLKVHIPENKRYLFNINDFLKLLAKNGLNKREDNKVFSSFYNKSDSFSYKNYVKLKSNLTLYFMNHDADFELHFGSDLFQTKECDYDFELLKTLTPFLYNIWHQILLDYIMSLGLDMKMKVFMNCVKDSLYSNPSIFTTNFDRFAEILEPQHLHGRFVYPYKYLKDLELCQIDVNTFYYKCIWGWNGIGKYNMINEVMRFPDFKNHFDFDFFYQNELNINHLLIYGIGFKKSGYIDKISMVNPMYKEPVIGGIIDEHILLRIKSLQTQKMLHRITFAYYNEDDLLHYKSLTKLFELRQVEYVKSTEFKYSVSL